MRSALATGPLHGFHCSESWSGWCALYFLATIRHVVFHSGYARLEQSYTAGEMVGNQPQVVPLPGAMCDAIRSGIDRETYRDTWPTWPVRPRSRQRSP